MLFKKESQHPSVLIRLGSLSFLLGALLRWFGHRTAGLSPDLVDGLMGLFYGLSIGLFLLAVHRKSHRDAHPG